MSLDLSFTKDPKWIAEREIGWKKVEDRLKDEYNKKEIEVFKTYFFTGESVKYKDFEVGDSAKIFLFPLKTKEAWEYVLKNEVKGLDITPLVHIVQRVLLRLDSDGWDLDEHEQIFDFIMGKSYKPYVTLPFPLGIRELDVKMELRDGQVISTAFGKICSWLRKPKKASKPDIWIRKIDYLFDAIQYEYPYLFEEVNRIILVENKEELKSEDWLLHRVLGYIKDPASCKNQSEEAMELIGQLKQKFLSLETQSGQLEACLKKL